MARLYEISIARLDHRIGSQIEYSNQLPTPDLSEGFSAWHLAPQLRLDLVFQAIDDGVYVTGSVEVDWEAECSRCVKPIAGSEHLPVQNLYMERAQIEKLEAQGDEDAWTIGEIRGDCVDGEQIIIDAIAANAPHYPLCDAQCRGLCARCGKDLNELAPGEEHGHDSVDPRWEALRGLNL